LPGRRESFGHLLQRRLISAGLDEGAGATFEIDGAAAPSGPRIIVRPGKTKIARGEIMAAIPERELAKK